MKLDETLLKSIKPETTVTYKDNGDATLTVTVTEKRCLNFVFNLQSGEFEYLPDEGTEENLKACEELKAEFDIRHY